MDWFSNMFSLPIPLLEKALRPVLVYAALIIGLRLAGKRELAQMNPFDLVVLLMLSNTVQNAIIGEDTSLTGGLVGAAVLLAVNALLVRLLYHHPHLSRLVEGATTHLIRKGKLDRQALDRELITNADLERAARHQGLAGLKQVETATLDPDGGLSFIAHDPTPAEIRQAELIKHLEKLMGEVAELRKELAARA